MEEWRDIPWLEWLYKASNLWNILSIQNWIMSKTTHSSWYLVCWLTKDKKLKQYKIHRIIAQTFIWNIKWKIVCHKDDNPQNNHKNNLFIWTHKDNSDDKVSKKRHCFWNNVFWSKLTIPDILEIRLILKSKKITKTEIARIYNVSKCTIWDIEKRRSWKWL